MKILFVAHRTPFPPDKGEKIRAYHLLKQLARSHSVSLTYWVDDPRDAQHSTVLNQICKGRVLAVPLNRLQAKLRALEYLVQGKSFSAGYYYSSVFQKNVDALIRKEKPDFIYVFSSAMACYAERYEEIPRIVDFVDVDSAKWEQLSQFRHFPFKQLYRWEAKRLKHFETTVSSSTRCNVFVSDEEAELFRERGGRGNIVSLPNGVSAREHWPVARLASDQKIISFVGTMNYYPNSDAVLYFAAEILPRIRHHFPNSVFEVVGRNPPRSIRRLNGKNGIRVLGEVERVENFLRYADVSVAPMRIARGVQNKILEAMASGVPVVATSEAVKGIHASKQDVLIGDTANQFANEVIRLLSDTQLRKRTVERAQRIAEKRYDWDIIGAQLEDLIRRTLPYASMEVA